MATSAVLIHTPNGNHNSESVNTHITIRPVVISEQLLTVRYDYDNCFHENLD